MCESERERKKKQMKKSLVSSFPCVHLNDLSCGEPRELTPTHAREVLAVQNEMNLDHSTRFRAIIIAAGLLTTCLLTCLRHIV